MPGWIQINQVPTKKLKLICLIYVDFELDKLVLYKTGIAFHRTYFLCERERSDEKHRVLFPIEIDHIVSE